MSEVEIQENRETTPRTKVGKDQEMALLEDLTFDCFID
jgi:hypothetical protein